MAEEPLSKELRPQPVLFLGWALVALSCLSFVAGVYLESEGLRLATWLFSLLGFFAGIVVIRRGQTLLGILLLLVALIAPFLTTSTYSLLRLNAAVSQSG